MSSIAPPAPPAPAPSAPPPNPNPVSFSEAVKANDAFFKEKAVTPKPAAPPADKKDTPPPDKGTPPPADKKEAPKPDGRGGLSAIKPKEEAPKKEAAPPDLNQKPLTPEQKQQKAWEELKAFRDQYADLPTKHEQTAKELEALRAKEQEWSSKQKEFETWQKERDMRDFTQSDDYKAKVQQPFSKIEQSAWHIAVAAVAKEGASDEQLGAAAEPLARNLMKALGNPNPILRERAIKAILEQADNPIPDGVLANFIGKGESIQEINAEYTRMEKEARLRLSEHETQQKAEKMKADTEARQILEQAYDSVAEVLAVNAKDVITPEMIKSAREEYGKIESDMKPLDTAFGNLSHGLVPQLIQKVRDLMSDIAAKEEEIKAMGNARPGINPTGGAPEEKPTNVPLSQAIQQHREGGYHF